MCDRLSPLQATWVTQLTTCRHSRQHERHRSPLVATPGNMGDTADHLSSLWAILLYSQQLTLSHKLRLLPMFLLIRLKFITQLNYSLCSIKYFINFKNTFLTSKIEYISNKSRNITYIIRFINLLRFA